LKVFLPLIFSVFLVPLIAFANGKQAASEQADSTLVLPTMVVEATKLGLDPHRAPGLTRVFKREDIQAVNGVRLGSALASLPGAQIRSHGQSPQLSTLAFNGLGSAHTLVMLDGLPLNSRQNGTFDLSLIPTAMLERVEIVYNGGSTFYGASAMGGVVNLISAKPVFSADGQTGFNATVSQRAGTAKTLSNQASLVLSFPGASLFLFGSHETSDGDYEYLFTGSDGSVENRQRQNNAHVATDFGSIFFLPISEHLMLRTLLFSALQNKEIPGPDFGAPSLPARQVDRFYQGAMHLDYQMSPSWQFNQRFLFVRNRMTYNYESDLLPGNMHTSRDLSWMPEIQMDRGDIKLTGGMQWVAAKLESNAMAERVRREQRSVYLLGKYDLFQWLRLFGGRRYNSYSDRDKGQTTDQFGVVLQPLENDALHLRYNVGESFRMPSFNDLFWQPGGNPELKPELGLNSEFGLSWYFDKSSEGLLTLTYTNIDANQKIVWQPGAFGIWTPDNIDRSRSESLQLQGDYTQRLGPGNAIKFMLSHQFIRACQTSSAFPGDLTRGKRLPYSPLTETKLFLRWHLDDAEMGFVATRRGKTYIDATNTRYFDPFLLVDINVGYRFTIYNLEFYSRIEINNATRQSYQLQDGYPMPLRQFHAIMRITF
jgi:vitamin B12 transporter